MRLNSLGSLFSVEAAIPARHHPAIHAISTRVQIAAATCACAGVTAFLFAVDPNRHAVYPECLIYQATGIYCPGCGATRAMYALLHGRVVEALRDNALFVAVLPLVLFLAGAHLLKAWRNNGWPKINFSRPRLIHWGTWLLLLMAGFVILRNLPGFPFDYLNPLAG